MGSVYKPVITIFSLPFPQTKYANVNAKLTFCI